MDVILLLKRSHGRANTGNKFLSSDFSPRAKRASTAHESLLWTHSRLEETSCEASPKAFVEFSLMLEYSISLTPIFLPLPCGSRGVCVHVRPDCALHPVRTGLCWTSVAPRRPNRAKARTGEEGREASLPLERVMG